MDLARQGNGRVGGAPDFWTAIGRDETLRRRVERLGHTREEVDRIRAEAERIQPRPERLRALRGPPPPTRFAPARPLFIRAFVPPARRATAILAANATQIRTNDPAGERTIEDDVRKFAESFLLVGYLPAGSARDVADNVRRVQAREIPLPRPPARESEPTPRFRPMFAATTVALPTDERAMRAAVERCGLVGSSEIIRHVRHAEMARAYREWRDAFVARPKLPEQTAGRSDPGATHRKRPLADLEYATGLFDKGLVVLRAHRPAEAARLDRWAGREQELVDEVLASTKDRPAPGLPREEFEAAVRAGRIGYMIETEAKARPREVPPSLAEMSGDLVRLAARLGAIGIENPLGREELLALAPSETEKAIGAFRREGFLSDGTEWVFRGAVARRLVEELRPAIEREVEADQYLIDSLIAGRSRLP